MKKVFALIIAVAMVAAMFAGCQNADTGRGDAIRIGLTGPLTGDNAVYGKAVQWGMEVAVEEINAKAEAEGGLKIEFKAADDVSDNEKAGNAYASLKDWDMQIFAGAVTTGPCNAIAPLAVQDQIFMMTPSGSGEDIVKGHPNVFQMCFTDPNQGAASAELIKGQNLGTRIGILFDSSTDYSNGIKKSFEAKAAELGLEIVKVTSFDNNNNSDMKTQLKQLKDENCDLVFLPIYAAQAATILGNAKDVDYAPVFLGCDGMDGILSVENFDKSLAEGLIMMTPFAADSEDAATQSFVAKYKEKSGGEIPNQFAADGYDVIMAIYEGCLANGITGKTSNEETCQKLVEYFNSATFNGLTGTNMTWNEDGMVSKMPTAVIVENGEYVKK